MFCKDSDVGVHAAMEHIAGLCLNFLVIQLTATAEFLTCERVQLSFAFRGILVYVPKISKHVLQARKQERMQEGLRVPLCCPRSASHCSSSSGTFEGEIIAATDLHRALRLLLR
jgi:hypothetical protein